MYEQCIDGLSHTCRYPVKSCPADHHIHRAIDQNVRFVGQHVVESKLFAKETLKHCRMGPCVMRELCLIVTMAVELYGGIQASKIPMPAHVVPVCVSNEDCRECRELRHLGSQRFIRSARGVGSSSGINGDQFMSICRDHKIIFCELETRKAIHRSGDDFSYGMWREGVAIGRIFGEGGSEDRGVIVGADAAQGLVPLRLCGVAALTKHGSQLNIDFAQPVWVRGGGHVLYAPEQVG